MTGSMALEAVKLTLAKLGHLSLARLECGHSDLALTQKMHSNVVSRPGPRREHAAV